MSSVYKHLNVSTGNLHISNSLVDMMSTNDRNKVPIATDCETDSFLISSCNFKYLAINDF